MLAAFTQDHDYYPRTTQKGRVNMPSTTSSRGHRLVSSMASNGISSPSYSSTDRSLSSYLSPQGANTAILGQQQQYQHHYQHQQNYHEENGKILSPPQHYSSSHIQDHRHARNRPEGSGRARALMHQATFCLSKKAPKSHPSTQNSLEPVLSLKEPESTTTATRSEVPNNTIDQSLNSYESYESNEEMPDSPSLDDESDVGVLSPELNDDAREEDMNAILNGFIATESVDSPNEENTESCLDNANSSSPGKVETQGSQADEERKPVSVAASVSSEEVSVSTSRTTCMSPTFHSADGQSDLDATENLKVHQSTSSPTQEVFSTETSGTTVSLETPSDIVGESAKATPTKRDYGFSSPCSTNSNLSTSAKKKKKRVRFVEGDVSDNSMEHLSPQSTSNDQSVCSKQTNDSQESHVRDEASSNPKPSSYDTPEKGEPSTHQGTNLPSSPPKQAGSVRSRLLQKRIRRNTDMSQCFISPQKNHSSSSVKKTGVNGGGRRGKLLLSSARSSYNTESHQAGRSSVDGANADSSCSDATQVDTEQNRSSTRRSESSRSLSRANKLEIARSKWQRIIRGENIDDIVATKGENTQTSSSVSPQGQCFSSADMPAVGCETECSTSNYLDTFCGSPEVSHTTSSTSESDIFEFVSSPTKSDNSTAGATPPPAPQSSSEQSRKKQTSSIKVALSFDDVDMPGDVNDEAESNSATYLESGSRCDEASDPDTSHVNVRGEREGDYHVKRNRNGKRSRSRVLRELESYNGTGEYWSESELLLKRAMHRQQPNGCETRRRKQSKPSENNAPDNNKKKSTTQAKGSTSQHFQPSNTEVCNRNNREGEARQLTSPSNRRNRDAEMDPAQREARPSRRPARSAKLASSREKHRGLMATLGSPPASPNSSRQARNQNVEPEQPHRETIAQTSTERRPRRTAASESARQKYASRDATLGTSPIGSNLRCGEFT